MNKKFSTLLVGAMLATVGVGSVSAQTTKLDKVDGTYNQKLYQIAVGANSDSVIVMTKRADGSDSLYVKNRTTLGADSLANSLWCVAMTKPAQNGQHPIFDFRNKATGKKLAIDINSAWVKNQLSADTLAVGVDLDGWAFSEQFPVLADKRPLYTYIPGQDSVVALAWDQAGTRGGLEAMKVAAVTDSIKKYVTDGGYVFTLRTPDHLTLNAHALHTLFGSNPDGTSVKFSFWKTIGNKEVELKNTPAKEQIARNVFDQELIAHDTTFAGVANKAVYFTTKKGNYLRVDTAWHNGDGIRFNVLTDTTTQVAWNADKAAGSVGHYFFQINYAPASDSVYMRVDTAIYNVSLGNGYFDTPAHGADSTYVVLQNLTENEKWALTVGKDSIATRIALGFGTCGDEAGLGRVSVKDGLYTIKDKTSGKYFAYPLYGNGAVLDWVEFDEESQLAAHMPAYQWIIDRTYDSGDLAETSPITIENREYNTKLTVQLYKDEDGKIFARSTDLAGADLQIVEISKDDYPEAYTDKYLGYYHRPAADIQYNVNKYVFRYFHPYALDEDARYLTIDNDSLLYAKENRKGVNFELQSYESKEYNYGVAHNIANGDITKKAYKESIYGKIGIVPLKRTAYIIAREGAVLDSIADKKYAMAQREYLTEVDSFYMKANNYYGEDDFFTIIKAYQESASELVPAFSKAGISDNNLNSPMGVQELVTERSSAFSIKYDDTPLYRRFNNANIGEEEIGRDSLKFREFYRGEYLMDETNTNFLDKNVDYLGIWTADKAEGKLAFRVDTAWVTRGLGYIKPQYLISVANSFYEGKVAEDCHEDGVHIDRETLEVTDDASACIHAKMAVPSFWRGKYLVSFADSVAKYNGDDEALPYLDKIGAYTRVGFVDAIQKGDSLYVLPAAYRNVKNEDIKFAELDELNAELKEEFDRGASDEYPFIINLKGDNHKNVTWSFRYVYPDEALSVEAEGKENSFLIESMAYPEIDGEYNAAGSKLSIAPNCAAWLKNQNGCLVLTNERSSFEDAVTGGDPALIFNVDRKSADDDYATDNEEIATSEVTVIAQEGAVRVANAEGKKVVITNVLGQVVANTVITSSDVVIATPAGVVVVAIEGEEAVKAVVK